MTSKSLRIISTVPSITELLYDLNLEDQVVGITKFCVHPEKWYRSKPRIGGTKTLHIDKIKALEPDLIIANKEENTKEQIEELMDYCEVIVTNIVTIQDNLNLIEMLATKLDREEIGNELKSQLRSLWKHILQPTVFVSTIYLIWKDPYMTVGGDTFINHMITNLGFTNLYSNQLRYPQITIEEMKALNPQLIMLSSEPFPFKEKHIEALQNELPDAKILLVDGEAFSWYGTRIIKKEKYLKSIQTKIQTFAE